VLLHPAEERLEHRFYVAHDRDVDLLVLPDLRRVDVDVDDRGVRREGLDPAGDPVIEPDADGKQEVALRDRVVRGLGAVHTEHAEAERVVAGDGAKAHQGRRHRDGGGLCKLQEFCRCSREDHPPACIDQWALSSGDQVERLIDLADVPLVGGLVAPKRDLPGDGPSALHLARGDVLREIDQHRAGTAGPRYVERLLDDAVDIGGIFHQVVVFGDRHRDAGDIRFLERVVPKEAGRHLAGERHDRNRVHIRRRDPRDQVACTGAGCGKAYPYAAARARVAVGRVRRCLFMPYQYVPDRRIVEFIVDRQH
jgi:hypothetical protein